MATAAQIDANRANSRKSTGPRSPEGKSRSSANALVHGLTGTHCLRTPAEARALEAFTGRILPDLNPATELQLEIARRIVYTMFRLAQVSVIEANIYALGRGQKAGKAETSLDVMLLDALAQAKTFLVEGKAFANLSLYEQRLDRSMHKDLQLLHELQREAVPQPAEPRPVATRPVPQPIDSSTREPEVGFVYATAPADPTPSRPAASDDPETMAA